MTLTQPVRGLQNPVAHYFPDSQKLNEQKKVKINFFPAKRARCNKNKLPLTVMGHRDGHLPLLYVQQTHGPYHFGRNTQQRCHRVPVERMIVEQGPRVGRYLVLNYAVEHEHHLTEKLKSVINDIWREKRKV